MLTIFNLANEQQATPFNSEIFRSCSQVRYSSREQSAACQVVLTLESPSVNH